MNNLLDDVNELIKLGKGDSNRLVHIKNSLEEKKTLFISDRKYVEDLISKYLIKKDIENTNKHNSTIVPSYEPKFCGECGTSLPNDVSFCVECGLPIKELKTLSHTIQKRNIDFESNESRLDEIKVEKPSKMWYFVPFFLLIIGGLIMEAKCKNRDEVMARNGLIFGIVWTVIVVVFWLAVIAVMIGNIANDQVTESGIVIPSYFDETPYYDEEDVEDLTVNQQRSVRILAKGCYDNTGMLWLQGGDMMEERMHEICQQHVTAKINEYKIENNELLRGSQICGEGTIFDKETNSCIIKK